MREQDRGADPSARPTRLRQVVVFREADYAASAADFIASRLPQQGTFVVTGGTTAARIYPELSRARSDWSGLDVAFSDERAVPATHEKSHARLFVEKLSPEISPRSVLRIRGELPRDVAAKQYAQALAPLVNGGIAAALIGVGSDGQVCALFPDSPALASSELVASVERPDGLGGITLTPAALALIQRVFLVATGVDHAEAVRRAVEGDEPPERCPVRLFAGRAGVHFLIDEAAASLLGRR